MADFILTHQKLFEGTTVLELGCGVGLVGIALAGIAKEIYLTDHDRNALQLCQNNVERNTDADAVVKIRCLDWIKRNPSFTSILHGVDLPLADASEAPEKMHDAYQWQTCDLKRLHSVDVFVAADVVYDDAITSAFFEMLGELMSVSQRACVCYIAIDKRFNFTLDDMDVRAPAYDYFLSFLDIQDRSTCTTEKLFSGEQIALDKVPSVTSVLVHLGGSFLCVQILDMPRSKDVELWRLQPTHQRKSTDRKSVDISCSQ